MVDINRIFFIPEFIGERVIIDFILSYLRL